ncbi:unnamed protein product [Symbiodinium natans]|uniref:Uncharacterized protein n=1 Tax=Symbiodinium natans TaxID=878477 RepID=A0A812R7G4_9DINO|nr:unnamed protein product [Symbiodinium natans]
MVTVFQEAFAHIAVSSVPGSSHQRFEDMAIGGALVGVIALLTCLVTRKPKKAGEALKEPLLAEEDPELVMADEECGEASAEAWKQKALAAMQRSQKVSLGRDVWSSPRTGWPEWVLQDLNLPVLAMKPRDMDHMVQTDHWQMALSIVHTNAMQQAFSEPILAHICAAVGAPTKTGLVQLWGDFTALKERNAVLKHSTRAASPRQRLATSQAKAAANKRTEEEKRLLAKAVQWEKAPHAGRGEAGEHPGAGTEATEHLKEAEQRAKGVRAAPR